MTEAQLVLDQVQPAARGDDTARFIAAARRYWLLFSVVTGAILAICLVYTLLQPRLYTATAQLMIDTRGQNVTGIPQVMPGLAPESSVVDTQVELLLSRSFAERVAHALVAARDPAAAGAATPDRFRKLVDGLLDNLTVERSALTYVISVAYKAADPVTASRVANAYVDEYVGGQLRSKAAATGHANSLLRKRLDALRVQVQQREAAIARYRAETGLIEAVGSELTEQEVSNLNQQLSTARVERAEKEARLAAARRQRASRSRGADVGEALGSSVIQNLRSQRAEVSRQAAQLRTRYGNLHPQVQRVKGELADIDAAIQTEINRIVSNLEAEARVARQREEAIAASVAGTRATLAGNNAAAVRLNELERNAAAVRTLYETFLNRYKETSTQEGMEQADAEVIARAAPPPKPSSPSYPLHALFAIVAAVLGGTAAVLIARALNVGLVTAEEVETKLRVPYLGNVPLLKSTALAADRDMPPEQCIVERPFSAFSEAFRNLRTSIEQSRGDMRVRVIAITSALPGEGKTTASLCLARSIAVGGSSVVLVDCDLRRRQLNRYLGREGAPGLNEVLGGEASLEEALIRDPMSDAAMLTAGRSATPERLADPDSFDRLLVRLGEMFDFVILDTAPLLPVADTRNIVAKADAVVLLARWQKTPVRATDTALTLLERAKAPACGAALTFVDMRKLASYGYGDPGHYYRSYSSYYAQ